MTESYIQELCKWWKKNKYIYFIFGSLLFILILVIINKCNKSYYKKTRKKLDDINKIYKKYKNIKLEDFIPMNEEEKAFYDLQKERLNGLEQSYQPKKRIMPEMSKGEYNCKNYLEKIFNRPFNKIRPDILKNNVTGHNLEIDLYNEELKLGIEYNGQQHYKYCKGIHKNYEHFQTQKYRDEIKKHLCKDNDITLIEVPYWEKDIESFLYNNLISKGFKKYFISQG